MIVAHGHPGPAGPGSTAWVVAVAALLAAAVYLRTARRLRRRGDAWPRWRDASFAVGSAGLVWASAGLLSPGGPFTAHMARHLVVGMAAPLAFALARPLTLTLRALTPGPGRRGVVALAHSRPADLLLFPPLAALLDIGGLWLLYRTGLFAAAQERPWLHAVVHVHVLAAGLLFTCAVCRLEAVGRRWGLTVRGATLLAAGAAHAVLAKTLYAAEPPGTHLTAADLRTGAQVMYYGGDLAEAALAIVVAATWYGATGRARERRRRSGTGARVPVVRGSGPPSWGRCPSAERARGGDSG